MKRLLLAALIVSASCAPDRGESSGESATAIVGGSATSSFPAVVALGPRLTKCGEAFSAICTATLVGRRTLLTAAHCVVPTGPLSVYFGSDVSLAGEVRHVVAARVHPGYDEETYAGDLAVLTLDRPAPAEVVPLSVAKDRLDVVGTLVTVVGFGSDDGSAKTGVKRVGTSRVSKLTPSTFDIEPGPAMSCGGDSGGPVLREETVIGVTSSGDVKCAVYGRNVALGAFIDFVREAIDASETVPSARPAFAGAGLCTASCTDDEGCADGFECEFDEHDVGRCVNAPLVWASYSGACAADGDCKSGLCARVVGEAACLCADPCRTNSDAAPPTFRAGGGGCQSAVGGEGGLFAIALLVALGVHQLRRGCETSTRTPPGAWQ